jgi:CubicO group peptidase (beta-lactamase class C family)
MQTVPGFFLALVIALWYTAPAAASTAPQPQAVSAAALLGTWQLRETVDEVRSGPITVVSAGVSRAVFSGTSVAARPAEGGLDFPFASDVGELRTPALTADRVTALWIQPAGFGGTPYASPVVLDRLAPGMWRGTVAPLQNPLVMTLYVQSGPSGTVNAFLREPNYNLGRTAYRITGVSLNGMTARFTLAHGDPLVAHFDAAHGFLTLHLSGGPFVDTVTFERHSVTEPVLDRDTWTPLSTGDGWDIEPATGEGFSDDALMDLTGFVASKTPHDVTDPAIQSLSVARNGKLVYDAYFDGFAESTPHDTRSAGKTYADVLAGVAMATGAPLSADTPIVALFPYGNTLANPDPRKGRITLGNALSMSTGLDCDDNDDASVANEDTMQNQDREHDWYRYTLNTRMVHDPGTHAAYCSASINLAGGAIAQAASAWLPMYFAEHVAEPLDMQRYALNLTPTGQWYLGGGAYVRPRDFLKVGQLFLDGGTWRGRRILDPSWITQSWTPRVPLSADDGYGYAWHIRTYSAHGVAYTAYEAQGNGGQILDVIPRLALAVMITAGNYQNYGTWGPERDAIVERIIAALPNT